MRVGSLFSGIGGLDLALESLGHEVVWQCEIDPFCVDILERRFGVPVYGDVNGLDREGLGAVDALVGGFPCQPVSQAGRRLAQADTRWLWPAFERLVGALRPPIVFVENVRGLLSRGMADVLGGLADLGYDAAWDCIAAEDVGAWHRRERIWIVAALPDARGLGLEVAGHPGGDSAQAAAGLSGEPARERHFFPTPTAGFISGSQVSRGVDGKDHALNLSAALRSGKFPTPQASDYKRLGEDLQNDPVMRRADGRTVALPQAVRFPTPLSADAGNAGNASHMIDRFRELDRISYPTPMARDWKDVGANVNYESLAERSHLAGVVRVQGVEYGPLNPAWVEWLMGFPIGWTQLDAEELLWSSDPWAFEPDIPRMAHGIQKRAHRLKALGNAVVPQCAAFAFQSLLPAVLDPRQPW